MIRVSLRYSAHHHIGDSDVLVRRLFYKGMPTRYRDFHPSLISSAHQTQTSSKVRLFKLVEIASGTTRARDIRHDGGLEEC